MNSSGHSIIAASILLAGGGVTFALGTVAAAMIGPNQFRVGPLVDFWVGGAFLFIGVVMGIVGLAHEASRP